MTENITQFFRQLDLTRDYSLAELQQIAQLLERHHFMTGDVILEEGRENNAIHFLFEGEAEVWKRDATSNELYLINTMHSGALFGEMSEMTGEPISASVRAKSECIVLSLNRAEFLPHEIHVKLLLGSARNIIQRLRTLTERQAQLMAAEAERQRKALQKQIRERDEELTKKRGELRDTKQRLSSLYLAQCSDGLDQSFGDIVGSSRIMHEIYGLIKSLSSTDTTVLITGESGTGKGMIAAAIHRQSKRAKEPFVSLNCAALSDELLCSELFGHRKGAFTGAHEDRIGRFQLANAGTIFLDEIGDISPRMQAALLRILESGEYERVGDSKTQKSSTRVIAATNRDLRKKVMEGTFREDLYYRLNVINIVAPPLRERKEDVPLLAGSFVDHFNRQFGRTIRGFSTEAHEILVNYYWPGNVRELRNVVERAMILSQDNVLQANQLPRELFAPHTLKTTKSEVQVTSQNPRPADIEKSDPVRDSVLTALRDSVWNVSRAADSLKISRTHLHRQMKKYKIKRGD